MRGIGFAWGGEKTTEEWVEWLKKRVEALDRQVLDLEERLAPLPVSAPRDVSPCDRPACQEDS